VIQPAFALMVVAGLGAIVRSTYRRTTPLGRIVLAGAVVHGAAAAALFCISWFDLPILTRLHSGDGFWDLASDARDYYRIASVAATQGLNTIGNNVVSPLFFRVLAVWMALTGVHNAAPLLLNLAVYVGTCALIVHVARADAPPAGIERWPHTPDLAIAVPLVALSGAPLLLLIGTQIMKDMVFACAIAVTLLGIRSLLRRFGHDTSWRALPLAIAPTMLWLWAGVYVLAGIRPYYGIFVGAALAITLGAFVVLSPRWRTVRVAALSVVTLLVVWLGVANGAAQYYPYYRDAAKSTLDAVTGRVFAPLLTVTSPVRAPNWNPKAPVSTPNAQTMREGFLILRGDTTFGDQNSDPGNASRPARARQIGVETLVGVAAIFVPITLLKAAHIVAIDGGRGLLFITDLDTLFLDATVIAVAWLLIRERRALGRDRVYLCVCLVLFALVTLMIAYVVTNFGMLVRLRVIALVPLWMATLAISRTPPDTSTPPAIAATGGPEARSA
jgi:hypothetical protein